MDLVVNQIMLPLEYNTKGILMSTFELGFTLGKRTLCTAMFLDSGYGTIIDQNKTSLT
jgi:hypothetical protein